MFATLRAALFPAPPPPPYAERPVAQKPSGMLDTFVPCKVVLLATGESRNLFVAGLRTIRLTGMVVELKILNPFNRQLCFSAELDAKTNTLFYTVYDEGVRVSPAGAQWDPQHARNVIHYLRYDKCAFLKVLKQLESGERNPLDVLACWTTDPPHDRVVPHMSGLELEIVTDENAPAVEAEKTAH